MSTTIEPGLLRVFRWFVAVRLGFLGLVLLSLRDRPAADTLLVPRPGIIISVGLLLYLGAPGLQRRLGRAYLPIALSVAAIGPIVENAITVGRRLDRGETVNAAVADYWLLVFVLFVPLILVAWQYRFRAVLLFAGGTTLLDAVLLGSRLQKTNADLSVVGALLIGRGVMFAFVGYFIARIVAVQREQRAALSRHAATQEQLATSRERNRLARELHDTLAHALSAVAVQLEGVKALWDAEPEQAKGMLDRSLVTTRSGLIEARRAIQALRASPLEELGLAGALRHIAMRIEDTGTVRVGVDVADGDGVATEVEQAVYRIADEALTNVVRHADAGSATLRLQRRGRQLVLTVWDDGVGFDPETIHTEHHHGLSGMRERAALVGGTIDVTSRLGDGTTVRFEVAAS